jgi:lantibiotic modifying enzyme
MLGEYKFFSDLPRTIYNPGLFQGAAGIGYALLRLAMPDMIPEILLWE